MTLLLPVALTVALLALVFSPAWVPELRWQVREFLRARRDGRRKGWLPL